MFMSFDMKFIRRDQKTRRNGEALPKAEPFLVFWSRLINFISKKTFTWYSIYHAIIPCFKHVKICVENIEFINIFVRTLQHCIMIADMLL